MEAKNLVYGYTTMGNYTTVKIRTRVDALRSLNLEQLGLLHYIHEKHVTIYGIIPTVYILCVQKNIKQAIELATPIILRVKNISIEDVYNILCELDSKQLVQLIDGKTRTLKTSREHLVNVLGQL